MSLLLRRPRRDDETAVRLLHEQLGVEGFAFLPVDGSWEYILMTIEAEATGKDLSSERVPADFLIAEVAGEIIGRVSIRHRLNETLFEVGGHIGYAVGPQFRGRGYGTEMLRQAVQRLAELGVENILVVCDPDNAASARVIEKCGGMLERDATPAALNRYWIKP